MNRVSDIEGRQMTLKRWVHMFCGISSWDIQHKSSPGCREKILTLPSPDRAENSRQIGTAW